jgi:parallel beta-helix repeat protein
MKRILPRVWQMSCVAAAFLPCQAASLAQFTTCISAQGQGAVCQLDAGTYAISSALRIGRSHLTIAGTVVTSAQDTVLQRAAGYTGTLMEDAPLTSTGLDSITIRDLTFDGNRSAQTGDYSTFTSDVQILTTQSLLITDVRFVNSPNIGLSLIEKPNGIVINKSYFSNSVAVGILSTPGGGADPESPNGYLVCPTVTVPDGLIVANSMFQDAGESAFHFDATNVQVLNNTFNHNKWNTVPYDDSGGQFDISVCSDNAAAVGNTITNGPLGANGHWANGIEIHATGVSLINNLVQNNAGVGIVLYGTEGTFVANWNSQTGVFDNGTAIQSAGITIYNPVGWRTTESLMIDHVNSVGGPTYGIEFINQTGVPFDQITVTNNCLANNAKGAIQTDNMGPDVAIGNNLTTGCGALPQ